MCHHGLRHGQDRRIQLARQPARTRVTAVTRGWGIKIKWPCTGADGGVLRAWWLAVDVAGQPGEGRIPAVRRGYRRRTATRRLIAMDRRAAVAVGRPRILPVNAAPSSKAVRRGICTGSLLLGFGSWPRYGKGVSKRPPGLPDHGAVARVSG